MTFHFYKYQGTGNDFIVFDNRENKIKLQQHQIEKLCNRRYGIGADGVMELQQEVGYDFKMIYYNADGLEGSMCGNGGRCITRFAYDIGIHRTKYTFLAVDGPHDSIISDRNFVQLGMQNVTNIDHHSNYELLNTGSPHFVKTVQSVHNHPVLTEGRAIRNSDRFKDEGVNVNFVERLDESEIFVRTYERGVEDETLSCGTGVTAAALVFAHNESGFNHVDVKTLGGNLYVEFNKTGDSSFENIWLCGPALKVFEGFAELHD